MSDLELKEVKMLQSPDGRLWFSQTDYLQAVAWENFKEDIAVKAKEFKKLCEMAEKLEDGPARALVLWLKRNIEFIKLWTNSRYI